MTCARCTKFGAKMESTEGRGLKTLRLDKVKKSKYNAKAVSLDAQSVSCLLD